MVPQLWYNARFYIRSPKSGISHDYDIERLHGRLLLGMDRLWMAVTTTEGGRHGRGPGYVGVVITSLGPLPDCSPKLFRKEQSLLVHFIAGRYLKAWISDAIEKIAAYGKENGCRQIFVMANLGWQHHTHKFLDFFERVGLARDHGPVGRGLNRPGYFRRLERSLPPGMSFENARRQRKKKYLHPQKERERYESVPV